MTEDFKNLGTELQNSNTTNIDILSTKDLLSLMNNEDASVIANVRNTIPVIETVVDHLTPLIKKGGRLFYLGAGTSGRLGVLDASEIPPTYSVPYGQFVGLIAGGDDALRKAQEFSEDDDTAGARDLQPYQLNPELDTVLGIASLGRTPYVVGALKYARDIGCCTIGLACVRDSALEPHSDHMISCVTGPEIVTGSTRMKAGTATKLILNMISTATMIKVGKTYGNLMVDLMPNNLKLRDRTRRIFRAICGDTCFICENGTVSALPQVIPDDKLGCDIIDNIIDECGGNLKVAIVTAKLGVSIEDANKALSENDGHLKLTLDTFNMSSPSTSSSLTSLTSGQTSIDIIETHVCFDLVGDSFEVCFYNKSGYTSKVGKVSELKDIISDTKFDTMTSIRVALDDNAHTKPVVDLFQHLGVSSEKVNIIYGKPNLCGIIKTLSPKISID